MTTLQVKLTTVTASLQNTSYVIDYELGVGNIINLKLAFKKNAGIVKKICRLFRKSPTKYERLQDFVKTGFSGQEYNLISDCKTRSNNMFYIIEGLLKFCNIINKALRSVRSTEIFSSNEREQLRSKC